MMSVTEILSTVYHEDMWYERESDEDNAGCKFCLASEDWHGVTHHYADCLLRAIRVHLMEQACQTRRLREAAVRALVEYELDATREANMKMLVEANAPTAKELLDTAETYLRQCAKEPMPGVAPELIYLGNNASGSTVVLPPEDAPYPDYGSGGLLTAAEAMAKEPVSCPYCGRVLAFWESVSHPESCANRPAEQTSEPKVLELPASTEVEAYRPHVWQPAGNKGAVRCVACGLISLAGATGIPAGGTCPGGAAVATAAPTTAPVSSTALQPGTPLIQVVCPRCHVFEVVPVVGGLLPDLPQITLAGGPFMVVRWTHPTHGQQTGVYCQGCWSDVVASLVTSVLLPAVTCHPTPTRGPGQTA